jgi:hypothetical protein
MKHRLALLESQHEADLEQIASLEEGKRRQAATAEAQATETEQQFTNQLALLEQAKMEMEARTQ